jgi:Ca2+-binding EF-hand superfamily protein
MSAESGPAFQTEIFTLFSTTISKDVIHELNKYFHKLDVDDSGLIKVGKIIEFLEKSGINKHRINRIKQSFDYNLDATINYSQFVAKVINAKKEISDIEIKQVFNQIDEEASGVINYQNLTKYYQRKGKQSYEDVVSDFFQKAYIQKKTESKRESELFGEMKHDKDRMSYNTFRDFVLSKSVVSIQISFPIRQDFTIFIPLFRMSKGALQK